MVPAERGKFRVKTGVFPMDVGAALQIAQVVVGLVGGGVDIGEKLRKLIKRGDEGGIPAAEVAELALDLQNKLLDARKAQLDLLDILGDLKREMMELDRRAELQRRYQPLTTAGGAFVLELKSDDDRGEPPHYICPDCADQGRRSFLQPQGTGKRCFHCEKFFPFETEVADIRTARRGWDVTDPYGD